MQQAASAKAAGAGEQRATAATNSQRRQPDGMEQREHAPHTGSSRTAACHARDAEQPLPMDGGCTAAVCRSPRRLPAESRGCESGGAGGSEGAAGSGEGRVHCAPHLSFQRTMFVCPVARKVETVLKRCLLLLKLATLRWTGR